MAANSTSFKKGFDPRRFKAHNYGVTEFYAKVGEIMRAEALDSLKYLIDTRDDPKAHPKLRQAAAIEILNRGFGKPVDRTVITTLDMGSSVDPVLLSDDELIKMIGQNTSKTSVIEGEFTEDQ